MGCIYKIDICIIKSKFYQVIDPTDLEYLVEDDLRLKYKNKFGLHYKYLKIIILIIIIKHNVYFLNFE